MGTNTQEQPTDSRFPILLRDVRHDISRYKLIQSLSILSFRRQALVNEPASLEPRQTFAYGVASVFCPHWHRKQGYTKHMMRLLHYVLASPGLLPPFPPEWGAPPAPPPGTGNACFSALWSDIGSTYYEACGPTLDHLGWKVKEPIATVWKTDSTAKAAGDVRWLSEEDCVKLWRHDTHYIRDQLAGYQSPDELFIRCTFLPDNGVAAFQMRRSKFFLPGLPSVPIPEKWGVIIPGLSQPTYATWTTDIRPLPVALLITRIRASAETLPMLLSAIMVAATGNGAATVEVWNLEQHLLETAHELSGLTAQRDEHLSALAWYGSGNIDDIRWCFNQK